MANKTIDEVITCMFSDVKKYVTQMVQNVQLNGTAAVPSGTIIHGMWAVAPEGYLLCDGAEYSVNDYYNLYNVLADIDAATRATWGSADWSTTFNVPDLRGEFLRGSGTNSHVNTFLNVLEGSGQSVGTHQQSTVMQYAMSSGSANVGAIARETNAGTNSTADAMVACSRVLIPGNASDSDGKLFTTRPTNTSVNYAIRI